MHFVGQNESISSMAAVTKSSLALWPCKAPENVFSCGFCQLPESFLVVAGLPRLSLSWQAQRVSNWWKPMETSRLEHSKISTQVKISKNH